jgi:hypothetical protein
MLAIKKYLDLIGIELSLGPRSVVQPFAPMLPPLAVPLKRRLWE